MSNTNLFGSEYVATDTSEMPDDYPLRTGRRVIVNEGSPGLASAGLPAGTPGTITGWGVDPESKDKAEKTGNPEYLIDSEGPVVLFDNGLTHWFPGQSMGAISPAS